MKSFPISLLSHTYQLSRNLSSLAVTELGRFNWHSHTIIAFQPALRRSRSARLSRAVLSANLRFQ